MAIMLYSCNGNHALFLQWQSCFIPAMAIMLYSYYGNHALFLQWQSYFIPAMAIMLYSCNGNHALFLQWQSCFIPAMAIMLYSCNGNHALFLQWQSCFIPAMAIMLYSCQWLCTVGIIHICLFYWIIYNNSPNPDDAYICFTKLGHHKFTKWLVVCSAPSWYFNQCWHWLSGGTLPINTLQWKLCNGCFMLW